MTCARRLAGARKAAPSTGSASRPDPRPGRRRARLSLLLPALALLLGALGLFGAGHAQAQTTVWSGTLTVVNLGSSIGHGCWNGSAVVGSRCSEAARLSDDDFSHDGTDYAFIAIISNSGTLDVTFDKAIPQSLRTATLNVGSIARVLETASFSNSDKTLSWVEDVNDLPQLTLNAQVSMSLVVPVSDSPTTVSLSASPTRVTEGSPVTVTARLGEARSVDVTIPLTLTDNLAEPADHGTLTSITITGGATSGTGTITTNQDTDEDDETFTVALDTANLPSSVTAGTPSSVQITIKDDDRPEIAVSFSAEQTTINEGQQTVLKATTTPELTLELARARGIVLPVEIPLVLTHGTSEPGDVRLPGTIVLYPVTDNSPGTVP